MNTQDLLKINDLERIVKELIDANTHRGKGVDIEIFTEFESYFRPYLREQNLRAIYRGPRVSNKIVNYNGGPSMTWRCDAKTVKFYSK